MTLQKQVLECEQLEQRQRQLQMNINFYSAEKDKLQSKKENLTKEILEQIRPEVSNC